jgi:signal transduction histidine kinase
VALQVYVGVMALSFHGLALLWEERARTAAALRLAHSGLEARYRRIVEQSPLAILALQPGGRVQDVNPAWQRLFVQPNDGALPAPAPWKDPGIEPFLNRAFAGDIVELPERELTLQGEAGAEPRRVHGFAYPVKDERGGVAEVVLIERDITDEVRARQQLVDANRTLREREEALSYALAQMAEAQTHREQLLEAERFARAEAERASLLKDEFLATLSHELRTPLNAIVGWAHILRRSSSDPAIVPAIDTIERNARAQAKLIEDLLDMSRIMAGKVGLTFERGSLGEIVSAAVDALLPAARARGVTLSMAAPSDEVWISCDAARVQQVVANLLDNGIKFTASGGSVEVRVSAGERHAQVVVRDNGQGIAAAFLPAVFDRFRQADGSTTRRHGGLGLGLSIARQIVEMHGGSIAAGSDGPGRGAVFTVTLPLAAGGAAQERAPDGDSEPAVLTGLRVLVVDDDADARELLQRLLAEQGCAVVCAASADDALREIARERPDVLLTDIGMPGADGYELLRRVREGHPRMPVLAITAFARLDDRDRAIAAGFDGHLPKPIEPAQLIRMLGQMWEG